MNNTIELLPAEKEPPSNFMLTIISIVGIVISGLIGVIVVIAGIIGFIIMLVTA